MAKGKSQRDAVYESIQKEVETFKSIQTTLKKYVSQRTQLDSQLHENKLVKVELDLLGPDANVFKLVGPVLVAEETPEAKNTVDKRIEYITSEIKKLDELIEKCEKEQKVTGEKIQSLQQEFQSTGGEATRP